MNLQKQKDLFKNVRTRLRTTSISSRALRMGELLAFVIVMYALAVCLQFGGKPAQASPKDTAHKKTVAAHHQAPASHKTTQPVTVAPSATGAPPNPVPAPAAKKPAPTAGSSKVEPVVTASPSASVSGLVPTTPGSPSSPSSQQVTTGYLSTNWSGYLATNATFTGISGSWSATNATGNGISTSADSTWIGIGGVTSGDLIQVGTQNTVSAAGNVSTSAFYEMLPAYSQAVPGVTVSPGDSMTASIREIGSSLWTISISDNTDGQSFTTTVSYASSLSSAEWIEEDPSYSFRRQIPFDNFGAAYFNGGTAIANGTTVTIAASTAQPVIMVNGSDQWIAVPSTIGGGGSFTVTP